MELVRFFLGFAAVVITPKNLYVSSSSYADAASVFKDIMANYTKELRPKRNQSLPVVVFVESLLRSVNNYEETTATLSLMLGFSMTWRDEILKWDPIQYDGIEDLVIPQNNVWKPDLFLIDTADKLVPIANEAFKVNIFHDGSVMWFTGGDMKAACSPNMKYFPFDEQTCVLGFTAYGYSSNKVRLDIYDSNIDLSQFEKNGAWDLVKASSEITNLLPMSLFQVTIGLKRKSLYYTITLIVPIVSLCLLNPVVFTLPYSSGERVSFCTTVLLSFAVYMTITGNVIPRVSEPFPLLLVFIFIAQGLSGMVLTANGFISRAYNKGDSADVPLFIKKIVRMWSNARKCCFCCRSSKSSICPDQKAELGKSNIDMTDLGKDGVRSSDLELNDENSTRHRDIISWFIVAKTFDQICFVISYIVIVVVSSVFLLSTILGLL